MTPGPVGSDPNGPDPIENTHSRPIAMVISAAPQLYSKWDNTIVVERKFYFLDAIRNVTVHDLLDHLTSRQNSFQLKVGVVDRWAYP